MLEHLDRLEVRGRLDNRDRRVLLATQGLVEVLVTLDIVEQPDCRDRGVSLDPQVTEAGLEQPAPLERLVQLELPAARDCLDQQDRLDPKVQKVMLDPVETRV